MSGFPFDWWLVAFLGGVGLFFGPLLVIALIAEVRRLYLDGIDRPFLIVTKGLLGTLPLAGPGSSALTDRRVFVEWDLKWIDHGTSMGRVTGFDPDSRTLQIALTAPAAFADESGRTVTHLTHVTFVPRARNRSPYSWTSVRGRLAPKRDGFASTTATVIAYPRE